MNRIEGKCKCGSCSYAQAGEFWQFVWMDSMHPATRIIRCPNCGDGLLDGGIARRTVVVPEKLHEMWLAGEPDAGFTVWGAEPFTEEELGYCYELVDGYWCDPTDAELPKPNDREKIKGYWISAVAIEDACDEGNDESHKD